jgi:hypothetical protein
MAILETAHAAHLSQHTSANRTQLRYTIGRNYYRQYAIDLVERY